MKPPPASLEDLAETAFSINGFPLLEFNRKPLDPDLLRAFVLDLNDHFTLVQVFENEQYRLNGYAVLKNEGVKAWRPIKEDEFLAKAAHANRLKPVKPASQSILTMRAAVSTAGQAFPLITIYRERIKRGVCHIGKLLNTTSRSMTVQDITPRAQWNSKENYLLRDITMLQFGGAYETLLAKIAGPCK